MTSKGQITVPRAIRKRLGLRPGDRLDFVIERDGRILINPENKRLEDVFGLLAHRAGRAVSVEEMDERVAARMREDRQ
ncbi:MAG: AbrB/MazE/SpoVT family DNA-binding domain-containing protein [Polyangia bacterium]